MSLQIGIVGLPNAGKSTLFNALLKKQVAFAANYPFATIEPNIGVVPVPDVRLNKLAEVISLQSATARGIKPPIVPATVKFVDIAGLVAGAHKGEGLGNKFLAHIREVELICHVVRDFSDPDVVHVAGEIDAKRDMEIIETELMMADLTTLEKQIEPRGMTDPEIKRRWEIILRLRSGINSGKMAKDIITSQEELGLIKDLHLLTMKPTIVVLNVGEDKLSASRIIQLSNNPMENNEVMISAKIEAELAELSENEQIEYLKSLGLKKSGLERLIQKAYQKLNLISFLTAGEKEVRAWTIERGTKAPQAAGTIHTDFEKNFIKAEVVNYLDFIKLGGWVRCREQGKVRLEGRDYQMQEDDVVDFKVGV